MKSKKKKKPTPPRPPLDLSALRDRSSMQSCDVVDLISPVKSSRPEYGDGDLSLKVEGADDDETEGADNKLMMKGLTPMDTPLATSDWRAIASKLELSTTSIEPLLSIFSSHLQDLLTTRIHGGPSSGIPTDTFFRNACSSLAETYLFPLIDSLKLGEKGKKERKKKHHLKQELTHFWWNDDLLHLLMRTLHRAITTPTARGGDEIMRIDPVEIQQGNMAQLGIKISENLKRLQQVISKGRPRSSSSSSGGGQDGGNGWTIEDLQAIKNVVKGKLGLDESRLTAFATFLTFLLSAPPAKADKNGPNAKKRVRNDDLEEEEDKEKPRQSNLPLPPPAPVPPSRPLILEALKDLYQGSTISLLHALEQDVLGRFKLHTFSHLGIGTSLLSAAMNDPAIHSILNGGSGDDVDPLEAQVHDLAAQALRNFSIRALSGGEEEAAEIVSRALIGHFQLDRVEELGFGPASCIMARARVLLSSTSLGSPALVMAHSLLSNFSTPAPLPSSSTLGPSRSRDEAMRALASCPPLYDLHHWSSWDLCFKGRLGRLEDFLRQQGAHASAAGVSALALPPTSSSINHAISFPYGRLIKVDPSAASEDRFILAASTGDAREAAHSLVAMAAFSGGGLHAAPLRLYCEHLTRSLEALNASSPPPHHKCPDFLCHLIASLPPPLLAPLADKIILPSAGRFFSSRGDFVSCHSALSEAARRIDSDVLSVGRNSLVFSSVICQLRHLGLQLGIEVWSQLSSPLDPHHHKPTVLSRERLMEQKDGAGNEPVSREDPMSNVKQEAPQLVPSLVSPSSSLEAYPSTSKSFADEDGSKDLSSSRRAIVDSIRREEFGLDNDEALGEAGRKLRTVQNDRMGRALQRLSRELYSTDSHFVLELVQNSDDNIYTDGVEPSLTFSLFPDKILVHNNEVGFSERNLRALCDVGKSTKASIQGFIGCKGIGWKSVFRVTDRPEIYSNGFRVKFDLESDRSLGFVLPTWINEDLPGPSPPDCTTTGGGTLTVLPLKDPALASGLALKLNDIRPTLLLFLRRLHHITIKLVTPEQNSDSTSPPSPRTMVMSKSTLPRPPGLPSQASIVQLVTSSHSPLASCDTGGCERWLVVKSIIQTKGIVTRANVEVDETELCVALPLDYASTATLNSQPPQQQVFAFLPLRSYGLRVVVQGDFIVPSSRESIDWDSSWNQAIRSELPKVLLSSLEACIALDNECSKGLNPQRWAHVDLWFKCCVPLPGEAQGFFSSLPNSIGALCRAVRCIPVEHGAFVTPSEAAICPCERSRAFLALTRELEGSTSLPLNDSEHPPPSLHMVHPILSSLVLPQSQPLGSWLGVREFTPLELVRLAEEKCGSVKEGPASKTGLPQCYGIKWVAMLLSIVFKELQPGADVATGPMGVDPSRRRQALATLASLPLLPLKHSLHHMSLHAKDGSDPHTLDSVETRVFARAVETDDESEDGWGPVYFLPSCPYTYPEDNLSQVPKSFPALTSHNLHGPPLATLLSKVKDLPLSYPFDHEDKGSRGRQVKVRFLDPELLRQVANLEGSEGPQVVTLVVRGLRELGVQDLTPSILMDRIILPYLSSSSPSPQGSVACLAFPLCTGLLAPQPNTLLRPPSDPLSPLHVTHHWHDSSTKHQRGSKGTILTSDEWLMKLRATRLSVLIKSSPRDSNVAMSTLTLPLKKDDERVEDGAVAVIFPKSMGGWFDLHSLLVGPTGSAHQWVELDAGPYLKCGQELGLEAAQWRWLFAQLGVEDFPTPRPCTLSLPSPHQHGVPPPPQWVQRMLDSQGEGSEVVLKEGWKVRDWRCTPVTALIKAILIATESSRQHQALGYLLGCMSRSWIDFLPQCTQATLEPLDQHSSLPSAPTSSPQTFHDSSLLVELKALKWLPGTDGALHPPSESMHLDVKSKISRLFGPHVLYLDSACVEQQLKRSGMGLVGFDAMLEKLGKFLGIMSRIEGVTTVLRVIKKWSLESPSPTRLSLTCITNLYSHLSRMITASDAEGESSVREEVGLAFVSQPLIWVPHSDPEMKQDRPPPSKLPWSEPSLGSFHFASHCVWKDGPGGVLTWAQQHHLGKKQAQEATSSRGSKRDREVSNKMTPLLCLSSVYPASLHDFFVGQISSNNPPMESDEGSYQDIVLAKKRAKSDNPQATTYASFVRYNSVVEEPSPCDLCFAIRSIASNFLHSHPDPINPGSIKSWLAARSIVMKVWEHWAARCGEEGEGEGQDEGRLGLLEFLRGSSPPLPTLSLLRPSSSSSTRLRWSLGFTRVDSEALRVQDLEPRRVRTWLFEGDRGRDSPLELAHAPTAGSHSGQGAVMALVALGEQKSTGPRDLNFESLISPPLAHPLLSSLMESLGIPLLSQHLTIQAEEALLVCQDPLSLASYIKDDESKAWGWIHAALNLAQRFLHQQLTQERYRRLSKSLVPTLTKLRLKIRMTNGPIKLRVNLLLPRPPLSGTSDQSHNINKLESLTTQQPPACALVIDKAVEERMEEGEREGGLTLLVALKQGSIQSKEVQLSGQSKSIARELSRLFTSSSLPPAPTDNDWGPLPLSLRQPLEELMTMCLLILTQRQGTQADAELLEPLAALKGLEALSAEETPWAANLSSYPIDSESKPDKDPSPPPPPSLSQSPSLEVEIDEDPLRPSIGRDAADIFPPPLPPPPLSAAPTMIMPQPSGSPFTRLEPRVPYHSHAHPRGQAPTNGPLPSFVSIPQGPPRTTRERSIAEHAGRMLGTLVSSPPQQSRQNLTEGTLMRGGFSFPPSSLTPGAPTSLGPSLLPPSMTSKLQAASIQLRDMEERQAKRMRDRRGRRGRSSEQDEQERREEEEESQRKRQMVGRLGEELVASFFKAAKEMGTIAQKLNIEEDPDLMDRMEIVWLNETVELGLPYDIKIVDPAADTATGTEVLAFIEVKATGSYDRDVFEVSVNEMRCAEEMGDRYYIVRVWGALQINEEQRVQVFRNPYELMRRKEMSLCLLV